MRAILLSIVFAIVAPNGDVILTHEPIRLFDDVAKCRDAGQELEKRKASVVASYIRTVKEKTGDLVEIAVMNYNCRDLSNVPLGTDR